VKRNIVKLIPFAAGLMILAALGFAALLPAPAYASNIDVSATPDGQRLENWYTRLKLVSDNQQARLDYSRDVAQAAQNWIDAINNSGTDATELQNAFDAFNQGVDQAQQYHDAGKAILDAHAGFDDSGNVTRPREAWDTIRETANNFRKAHVTITDATLKFREVVQTWRETH
jgi:hypothetical protein